MNREQLKPYLDTLKHDIFFRWSIRLSLIMFAASFFLLVWFWNRLPPIVPPFYSLPWGEEQLASPLSLIAFICVLTVVYSINTFFALFLYRQFVYFARLLLMGATLLAFLGVTTIIQILLLIT